MKNAKYFHVKVEWREIRRITFLSKTLSQKNPPQQNRAGGVAQGVGPEFKPQTTK
jgi:hypothetical protein